MNCRFENSVTHFRHQIKIYLWSETKHGKFSMTIEFQEQNHSQNQEGFTETVAENLQAPLTRRTRAPLLEGETSRVCVDPTHTLPMLYYLTLRGKRRRTFMLIEKQLKQNCIDMHQIRASQHCFRSLNKIDCNNLIMYQLLFFCLSGLVAVFQCLK